MSDSKVDKDLLALAKRLVQTIRDIKLRLYDEQKSAHTLANDALHDWQQFKNKRKL